MAELWDVLDADANPVGRTHERGIPMPEGDYHLVVVVWLESKDGRFLVSKRTPNKYLGGRWEAPGGSVTAGEDSLTGALREVEEELGICLDPEKGRKLWRYRRVDDFVDVWHFPVDVELCELRFQEGETCDARYVTPAEIEEMFQNTERGDFEADCFVDRCHFPYIDDLFKLSRRSEYMMVTVESDSDVISDEEWGFIPAAPVDIWLWKLDYKPAVMCKMAYIKDRGIAIRMHCRETDPVAVHLEYGEEVWVDSAMECFFGLEKNGKYINVEMNSAGNCLIGVGDGREGRVDIDRICPLPRVSARVLPEAWYADCFIPMESLRAVFGDFKLEKGSELWGNFFKVGEETGCPHYGMWSPIVSKEPDFHRPECFGRIFIG